MNVEIFNKMCASELEKRVRIKRQRGLSWSERDDKRFMSWFSENARMAGIDSGSINNQFFLFMINHSPA